MRKQPEVQEIQVFSVLPTHKLCHGFKVLNVARLESEIAGVLKVNRKTVVARRRYLDELPVKPRK